MTPEYTEGLHTHAGAHTSLGRCHIINGDPSLGIFHLQTALKIATEHGYQSTDIAAIHVLIGQGQYSNRKYNEAIEHYSKAIALNDTADARVRRAYAHWKTGDCTLANVDSRKALTLPPQAWSQYHTDAEANVVLAICYYIRGEFQNALRHAHDSKPIMRENEYPEQQSEFLELLEQDIRSEINQ